MSSFRQHCQPFFDSNSACNFILVTPLFSGFEHNIVIDLTSFMQSFVNPQATLSLGRHSYGSKTAVDDHIIFWDFNVERYSEYRSTELSTTFKPNGTSIFLDGHHDSKVDANILDRTWLRHFFSGLCRLWYIYSKHSPFTLGKISSRRVSPFSCQNIILFQDWVVNQWCFTVCDWSQFDWNRCQWGRVNGISSERGLMSNFLSRYYIIFYFRIGWSTLYC